MLRGIGVGVVCALVVALAVGITDETAGDAAASPPDVVPAASAATIPSALPAPPPAPPAADPAPPLDQYDGRLADPALQALVDDASGPGQTQDTVLVEVLLTDEVAATAALAAVGATEVSYAGESMRLARVPVSALVRLERAEGIGYLREPITVSVEPGDDSDDTAALDSPAAIADSLTAILPTAISGTRGGDLASKVKVSSWHTRGYVGTGVKVGIIDLWNKSRYDSARAAGEVPAYSGAICRTDGQKCPTLWRYDAGTGSHGVAVAEAIHDLAPAAKLYLADADTMADYYAVIDYFASVGVKVISRSLASKYDGPGDGTGPFADLVDYAVSKGMTWLNAAGNAGAYTEGNADQGGYLRSAWVDQDNDRWMEFYDPDSQTSSEYLIGSCSYLQGLRWNDWSGNATDYDIYFYRWEADEEFPTVMSGSEMRQSAGAQPLEANQPAGWCDSDVDYFFARVYLASVGNGTAGDILEFLTNGQFYYSVTSDYSVGQPVADSTNPGAAAVGAIDPVAGTQIAYYSSRGPTNDGRIKPDFSAGSNYTSYSYRESSGRFNGTSAATPAVSGMAALVLQRYPTSTPAQVIARLRDTFTVERGVPGADPAYGAGEVILDGLYTTRPTPKITGTVKEGYTLKASTGTWKPTPTSFTYQWYREASAIPGATKSSYKLVAADAGKRIRVKVTPVRTNYIPESKTSAYTAKVVALKTFTSQPAPRISGTVQIGSTVTALVGKWAPTPSSYRYRWYRDGTPIDGATAKTYTITNADAGTVLSVAVAAVLSGYRTQSKMSAGTTVPGP